MYFSPDEVLAFIRGASLENERLSAEIDSLKLFLEDIKNIAFNGYSHKDRILDIQKKFPSR